MGYLSLNKYGNKDSMANKMATRKYAASIGGVSNNESRLCTKSYAVNSLNIKPSPINGYSEERIVPESLLQKNVLSIRFYGDYRGGGISGRQEVGVYRNHTEVNLNTSVTINVTIRYAISLGAPIITTNRTFTMYENHSEIYMTFIGEIFDVTVKSISPSSSGDQEYVF